LFGFTLPVDLLGSSLDTALYSALFFAGYASVSATSTALAPRINATSASANQRAASSGLTADTPCVPRSSGGWVACGAASAGFFSGTRLL